MSIFIAIVAFLAILAVVILVHELGHFITAKLCRVKVEELGLGFPPRLLSFKRGETVYSLNLIPLGGFCRMAGEESPNEPRGLAGKSIKVRLLVLSAGSIMNALLPILLFSMAFMIPTLLEVGDVRVTAVAENSPAERAGIMDGDTILEINDRPIRNLRDLSWNLQLNLGSEVTMLVERGQAQEAVYVVPRWNPPEGEGATGIEVELVGAYTISERYHFWEAIPMGGRRCIETMILFKNEITSWFIAGKAPQVAGPIGIAQLTGEVIKGGLDPLLQFTAFLSMNLAIINLLPIPALDGARISFVLLEGIRRGKRISPKREGLVHLIGFALLILLMVVVSYYDIMRIMSGEGFIR